MTTTQIPLSSINPTATLTSTAVSTPTSQLPTSTSSSSSGLSAGAAAGIGAGCTLAALAIVCAAAFLFLQGRRRRRKNQATMAEAHVLKGGGPQPVVEASGFPIAYVQGHRNNERNQHEMDAIRSPSELPVGR
ncbi:hypothetical protein PG997_000184 [Apiospora hydei]|uniref:Uncharacterized protein n=1 Tax=Apiospora hydei TaxID=1337664 RepID=A0ABR1XA82_9PEZI